MPKELFDDDHIKIIRRAIERNEQESRGKDVYYHPTTSKIVPKSIDLKSRKPMRRFPSEEPRSSSKERWLEAYLIREAKRNNWILELTGTGMRYKFLYSQLKFRKEPGEGEQKHTILDLLLYDNEDTKNLVILELKKERELKTARMELDTYNGRIRGCIDGLKKAFKLDEISGVIGYIVWPASALGAEWRQDLGKYGLIEYKCRYKNKLCEYKEIEKPWEAFEDNEDLEIEFTCCKEAEPIPLR